MERTPRYKPVWIDELKILLSGYEVGDRVSKNLIHGEFGTRANDALWLLIELGYLEYDFSKRHGGKIIVKQRILMI